MEGHFLGYPGPDALAGARTFIRKNDIVLIPANNEARFIGNVVRYVLTVGFAAEQILIVDSHSTDGTANAAIAAGVPERNIVTEAATLSSGRMLGRDVSRHMDEHGVPAERRRGKGTAVFAGLLTLEQRGWFDTDGRLFLLDADLIRPERPDPLGSLLHALEVLPRDVVYAKCALYPKGPSGIDRLLASVPYPEYFHAYFRFQSLLGGQVAFREPRLLLQMKLPTAYGLELACHLQIVDHHGSGGVALVDLCAPLEHDTGTVAGYTVMDMLLVEFAVRVANKRKPLLDYNREDIREHNALFADLKVTAERGSERASGHMDLLLPSISSVVHRTASAGTEADTGATLGTTP